MASIQSKKNKTGKKTYYVVVSIAGRHKWIRAGTLQDAKVLKKKVENLGESERRDKLGISTTQKRIDSLFQDYLDYVRLRTSPNTVKRYRTALNVFLTFLKIHHPRIRDVSQIKPHTIEEFQRQRLESVELKLAAESDNRFSRKKKILPKPQTVNYEVGVLRSVFTWAKDREFLTSIPTENVRPLRAEPKREARILSRDECKLFLKTARQIGKSNPKMKVFALAFRFLLNTGLRSGELCNLTWSDVNTETGLIKIRPKEGWTPKSYSREFYLNESALKVLRKLEQTDGYVFTNSVGHQLSNDDLRKALIKIAQDAGFDDLTRVHDLRHTFNSLMQMNGVDPGTMGKILGHKDIETTMIYTHQTAEHLKKSIEKIGIK